MPNNAQPLDREALIADLQAIGLKAGDCVLVHMSFKSLGPLTNGAASLIEALRAVLGSQGTLCFPTLSYAHIDWNDPIFDLRSSRGCVGYVSEYFRQQPGVLRSLHLSHSVAAIGAQAAFITGEHHLDNTPCGPHSPFVKMRKIGGKILMLGCGLGPNTTMHAIEESMQLPYLFVEGLFAYTCIKANGERVENMRSKRHALFDQYYERVRDILPQVDDAQAGLKSGMIAAAQAHLIDCKTLWERATLCLRETPYYFTAAQTSTTP